MTQNYTLSQTNNSSDTITHSDIINDELSLKMDKLTTILLTMKNDSESKMGFLLNSFVCFLRPTI